MLFNIRGRGATVLGMGSLSVTIQDAVKKLTLSNGLKIATSGCETLGNNIIEKMVHWFQQRRLGHPATRTFVHLSSDGKG